MLLRAFGGASLTVIGPLLVLSLRATVNAEEEFCPKNASVDLTNATRNATGFLAESGHFFPTEIVGNKEGALYGCMCDVKPCVALCPPLSDEPEKRAPAKAFRINLTEISIFRTTSLTSEDTGNLSLEAEEWFYFFTRDKCIDGEHYEYGLDANESGRWYLFENGSLFSRRRNDSEILLDWRKYCLWSELNYTSYIPLICLDRESSSSSSSSDPYIMVMFIGVLISVPLLIATIFVYSVLPQLKNIHGKILSRYLGCLLVMNTGQAIVMMYPSIMSIKVLCSIFEFIIFFSLLTSFLWLNVMCFDMWRTFGGYGSIRNRGKIEDRKKLIGYSIYAWGTTVATSVISFGLGYIPDVKVSVNTPPSGTQSCWFSSWHALVIFSVLVFLSIICNTCLFVLTSIKLIQHQINSRRELSSVDSKTHDDNPLQLFNVNLKLFVIMGMGWSTFVIGIFCRLPAYVLNLMDILNELPGIPIFFILVCKKKIWQSLKMRFKW